MANASAFLSAMIDYWGDVAQGNLQRWHRASQEIRDRNYPPGHLIADVLGCWLDVAWGWWGYPVAAGGLPTVLLKIPGNANASDTVTVTVVATETGDPEKTELVRLGGFEVIGAGKVQANFENDARTKLSVKLVGLVPPFTPGHQYIGLIHIDALPLTRVHVLIAN
jgi:hypothetical protein